uniref:Mitochondrial chaperone BCS1 n=1 Tax=Ditylenchus dipsaci TaxID=166011 RepID=A0A915E138_9BILA
MHAAQECLGMGLGLPNMNSMSHIPLASSGSNSTHLLNNLDFAAIIAFYTSLLSNPVFFGSIVLSFVGLVGYYLRSAYDTVHRAFWDRLVRTLEITNENMEYEWIMDHINKHSKWQTTNLSLNSKLDYDSHGQGFMERKFLPGQGTHYFYFKSQWIQVNRTVEKPDKHYRGQATSETVTLSTYGLYTPPDFWKDFLSEAARESLEAMKKGLSIYTAYYENWDLRDKPRKKRTLESVVLAEGVKEALSEDLQDFLDSEDWYNEMGVPYRRGYLLYGPPGTGKTSFITALASHFGFNICIMSLSDRTMTDSNLSKLINSPPTRSFILLEDIDAAFTKRDKDVKRKNKKKKAKQEEDEEYSEESSDSDEDGQSSVTLSGMLNALDGVASCEERIIFMTTNHKDHLDSALIRPGRVDCEAYIGHCTHTMMQKMFKRFFKTANDQHCQHFLEAIIGIEHKNVTPAQLQRHFIRFKNKPEAAIDQIAQIQ